MRYRLPDRKTSYEIVVENPGGHGQSVCSVTIDEKLATPSDGAAMIPLVTDGQLHRLRIVLG